MKTLLFTIIIGLIFGSAFFVWDISRIISKNPTTEFGRIILKDRNGMIITDRGMPGGYSEPFSGSLDTPLVQSIIAIEDARFYNHHGANIEAKIASLYQNIRASGIVRGGSTITEQYIKNAYFSKSPRTIPQKIREMIAAIIFENHFSKEEILRKYLHNVYMGNGYYGVATIWNQPGDENQKIIEIITRLKYPNINNSNQSSVDTYKKIIQNRLGINIESTSEIGYIKKQTINTFPQITNRVNREIGAYCNHEKNNLSKWTRDIPENLCKNTTKELTLTIDSSLMDESANIIRGNLRNLEGKNVTNAMVYIYDPRDQSILAYIGNSNPREEIDMITRNRSVGSLLKPFIYLTALRSGADSEDYLLDEKTPYETGIDGKYFVPENYNPKSYGPIKLREALGNSLNGATVRLTETIGLTRVYDSLREYGITLDEDLSHYGYGLSIGTVETTMENIVESYAYMTDLSDPDIWQIHHILSDPRNRGRTFGLSSILNSSIPLSVKTGTSTDFRDNWTVSYHRDAIIGVWVGNTDGSSMNDVSGVSGAGPIWHIIAEYMIGHGMIKKYTPRVPSSLHQIGICLDTNCRQRELSYTKKSESPKSRPKNEKYYRSDFYGDLSRDEMEKWNIE